jgi:hypothetical protein
MARFVWRDVKGGVRRATFDSCDSRLIRVELAVEPSCAHRPAGDDRPPPYDGDSQGVTRVHARSLTTRFFLQIGPSDLTDASRRGARVVSDVSVLRPPPDASLGNARLASNSQRARRTHRVRRLVRGLRRASVPATGNDLGEAARPHAGGRARTRGRGRGQLRAVRGPGLRADYTARSGSHTLTPAPGSSPSRRSTRAGRGRVHERRDSTAREPGYRRATTP